ncbi:hypothetical protein SRHO_G00283890 [Serrasalmus rhombeus]
MYRKCVVGSDLPASRLYQPVLSSRSPSSRLSKRELISTRQQHQGICSGERPRPVMDRHRLFLAVSVLSCLGHGWEVQVPKSVKAVEGICVKISCHTSSHDEVKWYKYKGMGYPVVYSRSTADILQEFRGRTSVPGSPNQGDCSLQINNVRQEDNGISLYPWIYPETSSNQYKYIKINIVNPEILISVASPQTDGNLFSATCTVRHSCPSSPPPVQWVGLSSVSNSLIGTTFSGGLWTSVTRAQFRANRLDHSRTLSCRATLNGKSIYSTAVGLNVFYAPTDVKVGGADEGVVEGATISLTCTSKSNPEPTDYEWLVTQKGSTTTRRAPRTFPLGSVKRDTSVSCTARNSVGRGQSNPVQLNVRYAPTDVKVGGADEGVVEGATISLTCTSKSNPEPTDYEWLVTQKGSTTTRRASRTFPLGSVKRDTSVSCTARNSVGRGQSESVLLDVRYAPTDVKVDGADEGVVEGDMISLTCSSKSNPEATEYEWLVTQKGSTTTRRASRTFPLGSVKRDTSVSCTARNSVGRGQSESVLLNVHYAPTDVKVGGADEGVVEGDMISLTCTSKSNPEPTDYEWLVTQKGSTTTHRASRTFPLGSVKRDTSVSCTARNSVGRGQSESVLLDVHFPPTILMNSACFRSAGGVRCVCRAEAEPKVSIFWTVDGSSAILPHFNTTSKYAGRLVVSELTGPLASNVSCKASNIAGTDAYQMLIQQSVLEGISGLITAAVVSVVCIIIGITGVAFYLRKRRQRPADSAFRSRTESSGKNIDQFKTNDLNLNDNIYMNSAAGEDIYANTVETNKVDWNDIYQNY